MSGKLRIGLAVAVCAAVVLPFLARPIVARHKELRVVLTARGMVEGGNWLVPEYLGQLRLRKPPLMYWIVAASFVAAGTTESVWAARLPAAALGAVLVVTIALGGARLIGRRRALVAACVTASTPLFWMHARHAETDMPLCLLTTLAVLCGHRAVCDAVSLRWWLAMGTSAGIGFLIKGPAAIAIPAMAMAVAASDPTVRRRIRAWHVVTATTAFLVAAGSWYGFALLSPRLRDTAVSAAESEIARTALGEIHGGPLYYYLGQLPALMLPWSALLAVGVWWAARRWRLRASTRFLAGWFLTTFVALSIVRNKQVHYTVLLLPPAALLIAAVAPLHGRWTARSPTARWSAACVRWSLVACGIVGVALAILPFAVGSLPALPFVSAGVGMLALAAVTVPSLGRDSGGHARCRILALCAVGVIASTLYGGWLEDRFTERPALRDFAAQARTRISRNARVFAVAGVREMPVLEYYLHRPLLERGDFRQAWSEASPGDAVLVSQRRWTDGLRATLPPVADLDVRSARGGLRSVLFVRGSTPLPAGSKHRSAKASTPGA